MKLAGAIAPSTMFALLALVVSCTKNDPVGQVFGSEVTKSACEVPGNLVRNCGFDDSIVGWDVLSGICTHVRDDGSSVHGCLEMASEPSQTIEYASISQCVRVEPNRTYDLSVYFKGTRDACTFLAPVFTNFDCSGPNPGGAAGGELKPTDLWSQSPSFPVKTIAAGGSISDAKAVKLVVSCMSTSPFTIRFDDGLFVEQRMDNADSQG